MDMTNVTLDEDELIKKHKEEKKELQAKIQSLKRSVPKGDKKKKKAVSDEIAKLEAELNEKHISELNEIQSTVHDIHQGDGMLDVVPNENAENVSEPESLPASNQRISRAQKRRQKKENEAREREKRIAEQSEKDKEGPRVKETNTIKEVLKSLNLKLHNIPADGNCLYLAVNHQLDITGRPTLSVNELRKRTADYLRKHKEEFIPFMCNEFDESEVVTEEQFESYCKDVASTKLWGGQIELLALSNVLACPIKVIQASGPPTVQGESFKGPDLVLTYHRHLYRLGEHYNSTLPQIDNDV